MSPHRGKPQGFCLLDHLRHVSCIASSKQLSIGLSSTKPPNRRVHRGLYSSGKHVVGDGGESGKDRKRTPISSSLCRTEITRPLLILGPLVLPEVSIGYGRDSAQLYKDAWFHCSMFGRRSYDIDTSRSKSWN